MVSLCIYCYCKMFRLCRESHTGGSVLLSEVEKHSSHRVAIWVHLEILCF